VFSRLQKYIAQHSSRGAVRHHDLRADERVVLDRPVGRRDDFGPRRSRRKCTEHGFPVRIPTTATTDGQLVFFPPSRSSALEHWEVSVSSFRWAWPRRHSAALSASNSE